MIADRVIVWLLTFALAFFPALASAQSPQVRAAVLQYQARGGFTPTCSQSSTFLVRTSGLSTTERNSYDTMICGMVTDGTYALLDVLYIFVTNTTTTANLNLISTSFTLTKTGTVNFVADQGYTGDASTGFLDTGYNPTTAAGNYTTNSASAGVYVFTNRTVGANKGAFGVGGGGGTGWNTIIPYDATNNITYTVNNQAFPAPANPGATARGFYVASRTGLTTDAIYRNGNTTPVGTDASGGTVLPNANFYICAINNVGIFDPTDDRIASMFAGAGLSAAQTGTISNRINAYMTALGVNVY